MKRLIIFCVVAIGIILCYIALPHRFEILPSGPLIIKLDRLTGKTYISQAGGSWSEIKNTSPALSGKLIPVDYDPFASSAVPTLVQTSSIGHGMTLIEDKMPTAAVTNKMPWDDLPDAPPPTQKPQGLSTNTDPYAGLIETVIYDPRSNAPPQATNKTLGKGLTYLDKETNPVPRWEDSKPIVGSGPTTNDPYAGIARVVLTPRELYAKASKSVVIISTPNGVGSGFILQMDGKKYLITNEHVLRGGYPVNVKFIDGRELSIISNNICFWFEVADDRDLVKIGIPDENNEISALNSSSHPPALSDYVTAFGNSDGVGVVTFLEGTVMGIGPNIIEVNIPFIRGNSGGPIVDICGDVCGITTYAIWRDDPKDWMKEGTRFKEVRRFGTRLENTKWIPMTFSNYFYQTEILKDMETFYWDAKAVCYLLNDYEIIWTVDKAKYRNKSLYYLLCELVRKYNIYKTNGGASWAYEEYVTAWSKLQKTPYAGLSKIDWKTTRFRDEAQLWIDVLSYLK